MANIDTNIFKYATKELSQDAFIAWLCANYNDEKLGEISKKFIAFLANENDFFKNQRCTSEKTA